MTYETQHSSFSDRTLVQVGAKARYEGSVDSNDEQWAIQSSLTALGSTTNGYPKSGSGIPHPDYVITLEANQYGASREIPNCKIIYPDQPNIFFGNALVAIYHHGYDPEVDNGDAVRGETTCDASSSEGDTGPDGDAGGNPDPAQGPTTPIILDLDRAGFDLTDYQDGVSFDIDRDGEVEVLAWTSVGSGDGWLSLDRNGNGLIDDGGELFGNFTDQPASEQPNGYLALAVFDDATEGGDNNGIIDDRDLIFEQLRVWIDANHDGVSQPDELYSLTSAGVEWLETRPVTSQRRDRHGNVFRYQALARLSRGMSHSADAFLLSEP